MSPPIPPRCVRLRFAALSAAVTVACASTILSGCKRDPAEDILEIAPRVSRDVARHLARGSRTP
jgi:hypothetical protein